MFVNNAPPCGMGEGTEIGLHLRCTSNVDGTFVLPSGAEQMAFHERTDE
jgi:hypothetical protein